MDHVKIFKALANETRSQILEWLREPKRHFGPSVGVGKISIDPQKVGVCVGFIQRKSGLSQSTISQYLGILQDADLVTSKRIGQWTYYKRNEKTLAELAQYIARTL